MNVEELTTKFLSNIEPKLTSVSYNAYFKNMQIMDIDMNTILIYIDTDFKKKRILETQVYVDLIENTLKELTNKDYSFELVTDKITIDNDDEYINKDNKTKITVDKNINNNLLSKFTFANFIMGDSNKLAYNSAMEVAKSPGTLFNPFFLYGRSGVGKTHLMNAIGNYIVENLNKTVLYVTSEQFINDFTNMTRKEGNENNFDLVEHFKDKYRNIDVLIIDDIQMLQNATKTQDELFQTIDYLKRNNKQIILSSDKSPNDLKIIEERLKTRFNQGCTVNIDPPDYELKIKILKNKVEGHDISNVIDDEVFDYIANNAPSDVRSLEGSINRLYMNIIMFNPKKIDINFAREALSDLFSSSQYMTNDIAKIRKIVAEYYDVTEESLKSKKRSSEINKARQVAMYICKLATDESLQKIGLEFNRNHATVIHSCEKIEEDIKTNETLQKEIKEIQDKTHV